MTLKDLLLFKTDTFDCVLFYVAVIIIGFMTLGCYLQIFVIQPEINDLLTSIPIMDCKELGEKILNNEISYPTPLELAEKHWTIRCHGGLK